MIDDIYDFFRVHVSVVYVLIVVPVALSAFTPQKTGVVQEFKAFRIQHFDLAGNQKGSRSWKVNFDATSLDSTALRRCLVVSWKSLISAQLSLHDFLSPTLGAVVIVIPARLQRMTNEEQREFASLEEKLLEKPFSFAVYLAPETPELISVLMNVEQQKKQEQGSAVSALLSMITANSYHFVSEIQSSSVTLSNPVYNIIAKLSSFDRSEKVPSILIAAHYDSDGVAPALSFGADSNGSGVVALLELLRIFSKIYENSFTRAKYNLVFLLSGAGKLNYMGTRQYIDDYLEQTESSNAPTSKLEFAICLDSLLSGPTENDLYVHVSKIPFVNSSVDRFFNRLTKVSSTKFGVNSSMVSKKINLGDEYLAWEHERFSIRKLYAFTLSRLASSHQSPRRSILDLNSAAANRVDGLMRNVRIIAEALMSHVFQLAPENELMNMFEDLKTNHKFVQSWFDRITSRSRAQQNFTAISPAHNGAQSKDEILTDIFSIVNHYSNEAHFSPIKLDKRDPEFVLYGATIDKLFAYRVKPAVFDLILALSISGYLALVYMFILNASILQYKMRVWFDSMKKYV